MVRSLIIIRMVFEKALANLIKPFGSDQEEISRPTVNDWWKAEKEQACLLTWRRGCHCVSWLCRLLIGMSTQRAQTAGDQMEADEEEKVRSRPGSAYET